jgi:ClpP class serine protease
MRRASIKSIVCAAGVLVGVGASANSAFAQAVAESSVSQRARIAKVELKGALAERQSELSWLFGSGGKSTLRDLVEAIRDAAKDDGVQGMVIRLKDSTMGVTQLEEIGAALKEFRATGKKVHLFSDYYTTPEFLLG